MFYNPHLDASMFWKWVDLDGNFFRYLWRKVFGNINISDRLQVVKKPVAVMGGPYDFEAPSTA